MAEYPIASKFLFDIMPVATSATGEDEIASSFSSTVTATFGIEKVRFMDLKERQGQQGSLADYVKNTKKTYIDNQLSEYSSFAELVEYKNQGFRSCAVIPIIANGKVVSVMEMLSNNEQKFSDELVSNIAFGASFVGFVLMYKSEINRSMRLATYFDAAFNNGFPQFIIDNGGAIAKANKAASRAFTYNSESGNITSLLKVDIGKIAAIAAPSVYADTVIKISKDDSKVYSLAASRINENLLHIILKDSTEEFTFAALNELINKNREVSTVFTSREFAIRNISSNSEQLFGYSREILLQGNFLDIVNKVEQEDLRKRLEGDFSSGKDTSSGSLTLVFGENARRYVHFTCRRFLDGYLFILVKADLEKFIESAKRDLEDFISSTSDIVLTVDRLGYIMNCNMQAENILGFKRDEMIGKDIKSLYKEPSVLDKDMTYAQSNGRVDNTFIYVKGRDDRDIPATHSLLILASSTADKNEVYLVIIKQLETKTQLREQADTLQDQQTEIKKYRVESELKTQFIYNITHELKTPLTSIKGFSKMLYDGEFGPLNGEQKEYIKTTLDETDRLTLIIQQVLDAAKLEAEKVKLELVEVDLQNMANNPSIKTQEDSARNKGLEFSWVVDFKVPKVSVDPNRLIQVFVNLIGNSIKFTDKGGIKVHITRLNKNNIKCEVIDTGIGISEEDQKKLFKGKFYMAGKKALAQHPGSGTGLGLSITKDIVKLHGGKIDLDSVPGKGSTFWFTLPIHPKKLKRKAPQAGGKPQDAQGVQDAQDGKEPDLQEVQAGEEELPPETEPIPGAN